MQEDQNRIYRAALIGIGFMYEEYEGPLPDEWVEIAKRLIAEQERKKAS